MESVKLVHWLISFGVAINSPVMLCWLSGDHGRCRSQWRQAKTLVRLECAPPNWIGAPFINWIVLISKRIPNTKTLVIVLVLVVVYTSIVGSVGVPGSFCTAYCLMDYNWSLHRISVWRIKRPSAWIIVDRVTLKDAAQSLSGSRSAMCCSLQADSVVMHRDELINQHSKAI